MMQQLDVSVYGTMKQKWRKFLDNWNQEHGRNSKATVTYAAKDIDGFNGS